jgi:hypothetical protein
MEQTLASESIVAYRSKLTYFVVDASNNNLSGHLLSIEQGSKLYNHKYFAGNAGLCAGQLPPCPLQEQRKGFPRWVLPVAISSVVIALANCMIMIWRWRVYRIKDQQDADLIKTLLERELAVLMSLKEVRKATKNFAEPAQIGEGGFGTVYVGKLHDGPW